MTTRATRAITVRMSEQDFARLESQAERAGLKPAVYARLLVRTGLTAPPDAPHRRSRAEFVAALEKLKSHLDPSRPGIDIVAVINEGREEREAERAAIMGWDSADGS